uniref:Uncharacterized protein n=1 Tax=Anguilla anguilla TaxID=7936 RepID=A0A0E9PE52_ANGAN
MAQIISALRRPGLFLACLH